MIGPARTAAYAALREINGGRLDLPAALAQVRPSLQDERDRSLAADLVTGTLRWQGQLDHLIAEFAKRPLGKLDFEVLQILRLGAYQLIHLDRVPAAAAVNDAVSMTRRARKTSAAGLVNAVLRGISRNTHRLPIPPRPPEGDALAYLEVALSHPRWLAERWLQRYGFDAAERWETFNNTAAPITLRVNRLKTTRDALVASLADHGVEVEPARYAPDGLIVQSGNPLRTPLAGTGLFFLQDEASQLVSLLGAPDAGMRVLDTCASPGGKTTALAALADDRAAIVAADARTARVQLLSETVNTSGSKRIRVVQADLEAGLPFTSTFDVVFVDAPCSGLGIVRRDPEIRWRRTEAELTSLAGAQLRMIRNAADAVRPKGRLIYATCSSEPEENEALVSEFLRANEQFRLVDLRAEQPAHFAAIDPVLDEAGYLRTRPDRHGLEAFFGAVMRKVK
ncbi:MAG TPA: 16S rRNA (cytosine(967)-C(5))-methyltransferase RsmB [Vicinamibacterales bacterium]|nr:16S rRNA (cytosine(967)-C(5))-methyltransferase RsmB [Vicinamibacterales bacterium]